MKTAKSSSVTSYWQYLRGSTRTLFMCLGLLLISFSSNRLHAAALSGTYEVLASASTVNLTAEGTIDWAHWGRTSVNDFNHRAGVPQQITNYTTIGTDVVVLQFGDNFTGYSWTNGTPTARATRSTSGIYISGEGNGFEVTVPADTTVKILKLYVGAYAATMHLEASLSDNSATPYVDDSFSNPSDGPNRAYVLSFAAASAGQTLTVRFTVGADLDGGNVTLQAAALREGAPLLELIKPTNGTIFYDAAGGFQFNASTISPNSISTNELKLFLNDQDVSGKLTVSGTATARTATYTELATNAFYQGFIIASDDQGRSTTNRFVFDTFSYAGTKVIEAEDYNYGDGVNGGLFKDDLSPNSYQDLAGIPEVDYHTAGQGNSIYRSSDPITAQNSTDQLRKPWIDASVPDYQVMDLQTGDWLNYTRTFAAGTYVIYLRYASLADQVVQIEEVTGGATNANQTTRVLGTINAVRTGNENSYRYAAMTDALGQPLKVSLSGSRTLRLAAVTVQTGFEGLRANFLLFAPVTGSATRLPSISVASPAPDQEEVAPDTSVQISIIDGDTKAVPGTVKLWFDEADVTGAATVTGRAGGVDVSYQPPAMLPMNTSHSIEVTFADDITPPNVQTSRWTFLVASIPVLPGAWSTAPGSGTNRGFALKVAKAPNDVDSTLFTNTAARAEMQLAGTLIDPLTSQPVPNEAAGPNGDGTYQELNTINYEQDGLEAGYFTGDVPFPGVTSGGPDHMAMEAKFYLDLSAGIHRLGVRSDDGFLLTAGPWTTNATLELGEYEGDRGSGLPGGSTEFEFLVEKGGVYAFRLLWYEGIGGADLELFSVDRATLNQTNVVRILVNDASQANALKAYMARTGVPTPTPTSPLLGSIQVSGGNLSFSFNSETGVTYTLQSKTTLADANWTDTSTTVTGDGTSKSIQVPISGVSSFYRLLAQ
jgi:hypothetical protein